MCYFNEWNSFACLKAAHDLELAMQHNGDKVLLIEFLNTVTDVIMKGVFHWTLG